MRFPRIGRYLALIAVLALGLFGLAACGSDSDNGADGGAETAETNGDSGNANGGSDVVAEAEDFVASNAPGANELPDSAPAPPEGLEVWAIPCASAASGCQDTADGVVAAGEILGWDVTVFDGMGDPARWAAGINQAVAAGADAIVTATVDCAPVQASLQQAESAGVITINVNGFDCDSDGGEKLFTNTTFPAEGVDDWEETALVSGELQAAWSIANSGGDVQAVHFVNDEQLLTTSLGAGFSDYLSNCDTCEIVDQVPFQLAELGDPLTQKASNALLANPSVNYAVTPYDPAAGPVAQAITAAGRAGDVAAIGAIGAPESIELIRDGRGQAMSVGWDVIWLGWAAMDDIVRIANDQEPVYSGWALGIVDAENVPDTDQYHGPVDYEANYEEIWTGQ